MQTGIAAALLATALVACGGDAGRREGAGNTDSASIGQDTGATSAAGSNVTAAMRNAQGKDLGALTLTESSGGITVAGRLTGLPPGEHAIHLHTTGRCDAPTFESAGDHWNPTRSGHGTRSGKGPHLGDMPNITVARDSSVSVNATTAGGTIRGENAVLDTDGAAVVVHAKGDDYKSQPSGNSGDRIACGVVTGGGR